MARWFTPAMAQTDPARLAFLRARFLAIDPAGYAACCRAIGGLDLRSGLGAIRAPTLVVAGAADPVTSPAVGEALAKAIPGAGCEVVDDAAHIPAAEQPEAVNAILGTFLDRHWPAGTAIDALARGLSNRKAVLGVEHVQRSLEQGGPFVRPWQEFISRTAWGEIWGDTTLPFKTRSIIVLSMMVALHREEEFKLHLRPALKNGLTLEELRALLLQTAIYGGVPAANAAFRWVKEVLGAEADTIGAPPA
jgi:3-oxoadipate enol-lactonase/4-carboxymuconolactone decarboxylase